jgi:YesN/AraC family two-component response regulator
LGKVLKNKVEYIKTLSILFVEDEDCIVDMLTKTFRALHIDFDSARNGQEALEQIKNKDYDLIVTDVNMPIMNGFELIKNIRENLKLTLPIYIMSAYAAIEYTNKATELGVEHYLKKPFDVINFINIVYENRDEIQKESN